MVYVRILDDMRWPCKQQLRKVVRVVLRPRHTREKAQKGEPVQFLNSHRTTWHVTLGTCGTRLHQGTRPSFENWHNRFGTPFLGFNPRLGARARCSLEFSPRKLTDEQQVFIEEVIPVFCDRGGWDYRIAAAAPDHVQVLCDVNPEIHGDRVRRLLKRWLTQALSHAWPLSPGPTWWAEEGSNKAIREHDCLNNAYGYVFRRRATPPEVASHGMAKL
jgi:hypothetical protein